MEWRPIDEYDAMKKKPKHVVFWMEKAGHSRVQLDAGICKDRHYGFRVITHFCVLPQPPEAQP